MELIKILEKLCWYDKRNPNCSLDDEELKERLESKKLALKNLKSKGVKITEYDSSCPCDNCFYGRTELAEEILKLKNQNNDSQR
jgi:hypothetical protein